MKENVARYVAMNRRLGFKFDAQAHLLEQFIDAVRSDPAEHVRTEDIHRWSAAGSSPRVARTRYDTLRRFAIFLNAEDARHEIPPQGAFGRGRYPRPAPHLLAPGQIAAIMRAALDVAPRGTISPLTYHHIFGLLAATGLRVSEALALKREDFDEDTILVRCAKSGDARRLPLHSSTRAAMQGYVRQRDKVGNANDDLFILRTGRAPTTTRVHVVFVRIARELGIRPPQGPGPRVHDLRHSFAARVLEACPSDRRSVDHNIAALSAYLGHRDVACTYWYLETTPRLLTDIAAASETLFEEDRP